MSAKCITSGSDDSYRIGRPKLQNNMPGPVPLPTRCSIKLIALGWKHGHIVINDNQMYSWGIGKSYRLGTGNKFSTEIPVKVSMPHNFEIKMIATGDAFGSAISTNGELLAWGRKFAQRPTLFPLPSPAKYLACGGSSILLALADGSLQHLTDSENSRNIKIPDEKFIMTAAGTGHFIALTARGSAFSWGVPDYSGHPTERSVPTKLRFSPTPIAAVFAYQDNSWFVDKMNNVYRCGKNEEGCLGSGDTVPIRTPTKLDFNFDSNRVIQIACGDNFTVILTDAGVAYAAGCPKECRSAIDPSLYNDSKYFHKCTYGIDPKVTQIACGCYSGAFVIEGDYHPCYQFFERTFKDYPISSDPAEYFLSKDQSLQITPNSPILDNAGLRSEDIIMFKDGTQAKVIGVSSEGQIITVTDRIIGRNIETTDYNEILDQIVLRERPKHDISSFKDSKGRSLQLDISDEELFKFRGVKYGDVLPDDSNIAGARGSHLYSYREINGDKIITEIDPSKITDVTRNSISIKTAKFLDFKDEMLIETHSDSEDIWSLYYDDKYGAGVFVGTVHNYFAYQFACDFGAYRLLKNQCRVVRKRDEYIESILVPTLQPISISIAPSTLSHNKSKSLYPYDFVDTPDGYGCIAGFYSGKAAVWLEKRIGYRGAVSLYSIEDTKPIARLFAPLIFEEMSANSTDFANFHILPGDQVRIENDLNTYLVVGTKDGKVFAELNGNIKEINWKKAIPIQRHLYAGTVREEEKSNIPYHYECSSRVSVSQDLVKYGERTEKGQVVGIVDHSTLLLKDDNNQYITSGFGLPKIE